MALEKMSLQLEPDYIIFWFDWVLTECRGCLLWKGDNAIFENLVENLPTPKKETQEEPSKNDISSTFSNELMTTEETHVIPGNIALLFLVLKNQLSTFWSVWVSKAQFVILGPTVLDFVSEVQLGFQRLIMWVLVLF